MRICPMHRAELRRLNLPRRVMHPKSRRHVVTVTMGIVVMVAGSSVAMNGHHYANLSGVPTLIFDVFGYFLHGVGAVPLIAHAEPFWAILRGE